MKTREYWMPVGLSGIMDYSHIECKEYPVESVKDGYSIVVDGKKYNVTMRIHKK